MLKGSIVKGLLIALVAALALSSVAFAKVTSSVQAMHLREVKLSESKNGHFHANGLGESRLKREAKSDVHRRDLRALRLLRLREAKLEAKRDARPKIVKPKIKK